MVVTHCVEEGVGLCRVGGALWVLRADQQGVGALLQEAAGGGHHQARALLGHLDREHEDWPVSV